MNEVVWQQVALGKGFFEKSQYYEAEECLQKVVKAGGRYADVFCMLGIIAHERQALEEAKAFFELAVELNSGYADAWLGLSLTLGEMGLYEEAREAQEKAGHIRLSPPGEMDAYVKQKIANRYSEIGEILASAGWPEKAIAEYRRALELCPEFVDIRLKLANAHMEGGDWEVALEQLSHILHMQPDYLPARVRYGLALYSSGRIAEARAAWEYVLQKNPAHRVARMYMNLIETR
ncbi:MAG: tetratricopeptide repeat protein [Cystobacterineae bacterium]|nr:tetratricopeptide repeat protein [Cystobacterineae bacterium]